MAGNTTKSKSLSISGLCPVKNIHMNIGKAIKLCRIQRNMKQAELASAAGISTPYLSLLERGQRDINFTTLQRISTALRVPISIITFLASDKADLKNLNPELAEKLSHAALQLIEASNEDEEGNLFDATDR